MEELHSNLREIVIRTGAAGTDYDKKWEDLRLIFVSWSFHSPLPFARDVTRTYEEVKKGSTSENLNKKT